MKKKLEIYVGDGTKQGRYIDPPWAVGRERDKVIHLYGSRSQALRILIEQWEVISSDSVLEWGFDDNALDRLRILIEILEEEREENPEHNIEYSYCEKRAVNIAGYGKIAVYLPLIDAHVISPSPYMEKLQQDGITV